MPEITLGTTVKWMPAGARKYRAGTVKDLRDDRAVVEHRVTLRDGRSTVLRSLVALTDLTVTPTLGA